MHTGEPHGSHVKSLCVVQKACHMGAPAGAVTGGLQMPFSQGLPGTPGWLTWFQHMPHVLQKPSWNLDVIAKESSRDAKLCPFVRLWLLMTEQPYRHLSSLWLAG